MILVLEPNTDPEGVDYRMLTSQLERLHNIRFRVHREVGTEVTLTEMYLIGNTGALTVEQASAWTGATPEIVRISVTRHRDTVRTPVAFNAILKALA